LRRWCVDVGRDASRLKPIAAPLTAKDVAVLALGRLRRAQEGDTYLSSPWTRGSLAMSNPFSRLLATWLLPSTSVQLARKPR
jgi:hypothetical protein